MAQDWRDIFARRVAVMRRHGAITGWSMPVTPYTSKSYEDDVAWQVLIAMRDAIAEDIYEKCERDVKKFQETYSSIDDFALMKKGEHAHYIAEALSSILEAHPFKEPA